MSRLKLKKTERQTDEKLTDGDGLNDRSMVDLGGRTLVLGKAHPINWIKKCQIYRFVNWGGYLELVPRFSVEF